MAAARCLPLLSVLTCDGRLIVIYKKVMLESQLSILISERAKWCCLCSGLSEPVVEELCVQLCIQRYLGGNTNPKVKCRVGEHATSFQNQI